MFSLPPMFTSARLSRSRSGNLQPRFSGNSPSKGTTTLPQSLSEYSLVSSEPDEFKTQSPGAKENITSTNKVPQNKKAQEAKEICDTIVGTDGNKPLRVADLVALLSSKNEQNIRGTVHSLVEPFKTSNKTKTIDVKLLEQQFKELRRTGHLSAAKLQHRRSKTGVPSETNYTVTEAGFNLLKEHYPESLSKKSK